MIERLLKVTENIWKQYYSHPFVKGIQDGTLDKEKFRYYIIQDYLYLEEYAKVFAIGLAKAKSLSTTRLFSGYIDTLTGEKWTSIEVIWENLKYRKKNWIKHLAHWIIFHIHLICFVLLMKKEKLKF